MNKSQRNKAAKLQSFVKVFFLISFFIFNFAFCISPALADKVWNEEIEIVNHQAEITETDFDFFALHIPYGTRAELLINGEWEILERETERDPGSVLSKLITWERGEKISLRFNGVPVAPVTADFMRIDKTEEFALAGATASTGKVGDLSIISRKKWGANESLRYSKKKVTDVEEKDSGTSLGAREKACVNAKKSYPDEFEIKKVTNYENGKELIWPYQYSKRVRKVVIHHTAESGANGSKTAEEVMRGIYYYHTVSRGWGDIGYHYVISPDGKIFEGRAGGEFVTGGHAYCHNIGSIGISLMGNFENDNPTSLQIAALQKLLPELADIYELDLTSKSWYHGEKTNNLLGHRDLTPTVCPGKNMYSKIPSLLKNISRSAGIQKAKSVSVDGVPTKNLKIIKMRPGETKDITLSFTNTGNADWLTGNWLFAQPGKGIEVRSVSSKKNYVAAKQQQKMVQKGEVATFKASVTAGYSGGIYTVSFVPVVRDTRIKNAEVVQVIEVESPDWDGKMTDVRTQPKVPGVGESFSISVDIKNTGKTIWRAQQAALELTIPGTSVRTYLPLKTTTPSGKVGTFSGRISAFEQKSAGDILLRMRLQIQQTPTTAFFIKNISTQAASDSAQITKKIPRLVSATPGKDFTYTFTFLNTGTIEWNKNDLALQLLLRRQKVTLQPKENYIAPGKIATFKARFPAGERIEPYVYSLKNGYKKLQSGLFLLYWKKEISQNSNPMPIDIVEKSTNSTPEEKNIRVRLSFPKELKKTELSVNGNFSVRDAKGKILGTYAKGKKIDIYQKNNLLSYNGQTSTFFRIVPEKNAIVEIENWDRHPAWDTRKKWNDNRFYGTIEVRMLNGEITVINELPIEKYMLGIGETLESDHIEKKKALAIAARSYATFYQKTENRKFSGKPYDASDDPAEFQKYLGASLTDRSPGWKTAVAATTGKNIYYNNRLIKPPYHTCSGGQTTSAEDKWGWKDTPYLVSVNDPGCQGKAQAGHGVGMSGGGAQYFAEKGWSYTSILKYFYPGTEIK